MSDTDQNLDKIDLDTLTDDEVMDLEPKAVQSLMDQESREEDVLQQSQDTADESNNNEVENNSTSDVEQSNSELSESNSNGDTSDNIEKTDETEEVSSEEQSSKSETITEEKEQISEKDNSQSQETEQEVQNESEEEKETKKDSKQNEQNVNNEALDFQKKITAPFKADGKDMQIRTAEDAIRLMQMGVNYSRRMQEMKPLKAQDALLRQHGLNDPEKLSYLVDLHKGKPEAIQKLLKDNNIDPLDIDTSKDSNYTNSNYTPDSKQLDFEEAIQNTLSNPHGQSLITDINKMWDDSSKEALRDQPEIFNNLLDQMNSGVYEQVKGELEYQRTLGHMTSVPFLQAYQQVGNAMQKAGVFDKPKNHSDGLAPLQSEATKPIPIDTGTRKVANKPKTQQPNPNLSSAPRSVPSNDGVNQEIDYSSMSDDDFLKLGNPS